MNSLVVKLYQLRKSFCLWMLMQPVLQVYDNDAEKLNAPLLKLCIFVSHVTRREFRAFKAIPIK